MRLWLLKACRGCLTCVCCCLMHACLLQNPVNSLEWMEADIHLLAPFVSLAMDTRNFCQPLQRVKVVVLLTAIFVTTANVAVLARSSHNPFNLYNFEQSFRLELAGVLFAEAFMYWLTVRGMRYLLERRQHRRLHPGTSQETQ